MDALVFRLLGIGASANDLYYRLGENDEPVVFAEDYRSPFYLRPRGNELRFYRIEKGADGTEQRIPVVEAVIPEGMKYPLVVFSPAGDGLSANVIDDGLEAFPGGTYRVFNRLDYEVGLIVGKERSLADKGSVVLLRGVPEEGRRVLLVQILRKKGQDVPLLFSNKWAFNPQLRTMVLITPPLPPSTFPVVRRIVEPDNIFLNIQTSQTTSPPLP